MDAPVSPDPSRLQELLGSLHGGILAVDADGCVELINAEASRILGVSAEAALGRMLDECLGAAHPVARAVTIALAERRDVAQNRIALHAGLLGELVVDVAAAPVAQLDPPGGAVVTLVDRTIGQELEAHVDQAARSEAFARLAAGIAHELRNPLGGIRGVAELLEAKLVDTDLRAYPSLIRSEADRMWRLLDDLAELTRGGDLRPLPTNLHQVLDALLELHVQPRDWPGVRVERQYDPSIPRLELDPDRMSQVFLNLIRNALQAMDGRGQLTLRTRVESGYHLAQDRRPVQMVRIEIEDTGPGIPPDELQHVFTPFYTRGKAGGTGLGLSIAQHWAVRHGGNVQLSSQTGTGTRARVRLPLRKAP
jgi:two-component system nitrogen regulation sensor histidine kinase GlnL